MVHYGNPVEDLIRIFATGLSAKDRKIYTDELLGYYRTRITALLPELEGVTRHSVSLPLAVPHHAMVRGPLLHSKALVSNFSCCFSIKLATHGEVRFSSFPPGTKKRFRWPVYGQSLAFTHRSNQPRPESRRMNENWKQFSRRFEESPSISWKSSAKEKRTIFSLHFLIFSNCCCDFGAAVVGWNMPLCKWWGHTMSDTCNMLGATLTNQHRSRKLLVSTI